MATSFAPSVPVRLPPASKLRSFGPQICPQLGFPVDPFHLCLWSTPVYIYIYIILCGWGEVGWGGGGWLLKLEEHVTRITLETCQAPVPSRPVMKYPEGGTPQSDQERLSSSLPCGRARGSRRRGRWRSTTSGGLGCLARALGKRTGRARARPQS